MTRDYTTVNIPNHLADRIRKVLKTAGYLNLSDFIRDSMRMRLEEFKREATQIEPIDDILEKACEGLRGFRSLIWKILGKSPEDVRETLRAMEGLTPAQIRDALRAYGESTDRPTSNEGEKEAEAE